MTISLGLKELATWFSIRHLNRETALHLLSNHTNSFISLSVIREHVQRSPSRMCIVLISTAHPSYRLILINNRDEFLNRPTAPASWWPEPYSHVLGGRDLLRSEQGTWLGVTKQGRISALTNFRESSSMPQTAVSRGAIIRAFLTEPHQSTEAFIKGMAASGVSKNAGGFSLVCGNVGEPLAVISNRASSEAEIPWIHPGTPQTVGLSNAAFGDRGWKKVADGEAMLKGAITKSMETGEGEGDFIQRLIKLLSTDTLTGSVEGGDLRTHVDRLRNTIFVPVIGQPGDLHADEIAAAATGRKATVVSNSQQLGLSGLYGTQKQTVVLVDHSGRVRFFERTLHGNDGRPVALGQGDVDLDFHIEG